MKMAFAKGEDLRDQTAVDCFGTKARRDDAKAINFGRIYGMTEFGLSKKIGITPPEARRWLRKHARAYPGVPRFHLTIERAARRQGYVETTLGARRYFDASQRQKFGWERAAYNHPVQGSAGELFKFAMARVHEAVKPYDAIPVLTIHDELVIECPVACVREVGNIVSKVMAEGLEPLGRTLSVPLKVEWSVQDRWGQNRVDAPAGSHHIEEDEVLT